MDEINHLTEAEATDLWIELHADPDLEEIMEEAQAGTNSAHEAITLLAEDPDLLPILIEVSEAIHEGR